jgi:hypothetical protein
VKIGYLVTFMHGYNGLPIEGIAGDSIKVLLDREGVALYYRMWREINTKEVSSKPKKIITEEEAIKATKEYAKLHRIDSNETKVKKTQMTYYSMPFRRFPEQQCTCAFGGRYGAREDDRGIGMGCGAG